MPLEQAREFLDEYIQHRERFEERIKERFPVAYSLRRMGTETLKSVRGLLESPEGKNQGRNGRGKRRKE